VPEEHDPEHDLTLQLHDAILRATETLPLREAAALFPGVSYSTLSAKRLGNFQIITLYRLAAGKVPEVSNLARRLLRFKGESGNNLISLDHIRERASKRRRKLNRAFAASGVLMHAALQLETADFSQGDLPAILLRGCTPMAKMYEHAIADLISTFVDAAYFSALSRALWKRINDSKFTRIPVHPFGTIGIDSHYRMKRPSELDERMTQSLRALGRRPGDVFEQCYPKPALPAPDFGRDAYSYLYDLCLCVETDTELAEPELLFANAAVASFRSTLAALSAAVTITDLAIEPALPAPLFNIASEIRKLSHYTYVEKSEEATHAIEQLPDRLVGTNSDRQYLKRFISLSIRTLADDGGAWFIVFDSQYAFVSPWGSLLQKRDSDECMHQIEFAESESGMRLPKDIEPGSNVFFPT
jgi:hypothetical protein